MSLGGLFVVSCVLARTKYTLFKLEHKKALSFTINYAKFRPGNPPFG